MLECGLQGLKAINSSCCKNHDYKQRASAVDEEDVRSEQNHSIVSLLNVYYKLYIVECTATNVNYPR